jgi:hypothetical protein
MLPEYNERKKTSFFFMNYERYEAERSMGYEPEFMRNMLQLNNGNIQHGDTSLPFFSEIGQLAGIQSTDWSWSVLLADVDNDGWKDIHITNGIGRDFINADFLEFSNTIFAGNKSKEEQQQVIREKLASLKHVSLPNYLYLSNHDLTFSDASQAAGIDELSMSNGAAYADLDNDGDLDIVVNNIDKPAFVFINNSIQKDKPVTNHSISINLQGDSLNRHAFGAKVFVYNDGRLQLQEQNPVRGYFSSVDQKLLFGVGKAARIDSMVIQWPGSRRTVLTNIAADTLITVAVSDAVGFNPGKAISQPTIFSDAVFATNIFYQHKDNVYNDFALQRLLPQKFSQLGPFITTGDINKDGLADFFIGGAFNFSGRFFVQQPNGSFVARILTDSIKMEEDMDCVLFDADDDGDVDLLIGSGDLLYEDSAAYYVPRLYLNNGKGNFSLRPNAIPATVKAIAGSISIGDYDGDGSPDVFIGGRVSHQYPLAPRSFILHNNKGVFTDVTATVCPVLQQPGMVTAAAWTDFDNDHQLDLIVAGEWMPIRFFKNNHGQLLEVTGNTGLGPMNGMWRSMTIADMDNDGDADIVAGNLGLNCIYHTNETVPMQLLAADLDGNGSIDPVFFYYIKDNDGKKSLFPSISRTQLSEQVPAVKKQFLYNKQYAVATADDIFKGKAKDNKVTLTCTETRSCYLENLGNGKFAKHPLPIAAQFAPVNAIICDDIDGDGKMDIVLAGNEYQADVMTGRYDASYGCFLKGNGKNIFTSITPVQSGLVLNGDIKDMSLLRTAKGEKLLLAAANNDSLRVFRVKK